MLQQIDQGWYEGTNDPVPFIRYMLKIILACYAEFEQRVGLVNAEGTRSTAQQIVEHYVNGKIGRFTSAEVMAACPMIARSTVLRELKELTRKGVLQRLGTGKTPAMSAGMRWRSKADSSHTLALSSKMHPVLDENLDT